MGSTAVSFSALSKKLTSLNSDLSPHSSRMPFNSGEGAGPLGFSTARTKARQQLDQALAVPPSVGDPGYVAPPNLNVTPVTPMPVPGQDDLASIAARRQSIQQQLARRGRVSTILSNAQNEPLGG